MTLEKYHIEPVVGLIFQAYMSRKDIGSGVRMFMVYKVGRKFVYLFYAPRLQSLRFTRGEWYDLYMEPVPLFRTSKYRANVARIAADYARFGRKHSQVLVDKVLSIEPTCGHDLFTRSEA